MIAKAEPRQEKINLVVAKGFTKEQAYRALAATRNDVDLAIERLMAAAQKEEMERRAAAKRWAAEEAAPAKTRLKSERAAAVIKMAEESKKQQAYRAPAYHQKPTFPAYAGLDADEGKMQQDEVSASKFGELDKAILVSPNPQIRSQQCKPEPQPWPQQHGSSEAAPTAPRAGAHLQSAPFPQLGQPATCHPTAPRAGAHLNSALFPQLGQPASGGSGGGSGSGGTEGGGGARGTGGGGEAGGRDGGGSKDAASPDDESPDATCFDEEERGQLMRHGLNPLDRQTDINKARGDTLGLSYLPMEEDKTPLPKTISSNASKGGPKAAYSQPTPPSGTNQAAPKPKPTSLPSLSLPICCNMREGKENSSLATSISRNRQQASQRRVPTPKLSDSVGHTVSKATAHKI